MSSSSSSKRVKILLVEDDKIQRMVARRLADMLDLEMEEAENGQAAVDYFRGGGACDLVFMDRDMPLMDGHEATRQLRSMGIETPIVALSADDLQPYRDIFLQSGANEFQPKPLSVEKLMQVLVRYGLDAALLSVG